MDRFAEDYQHFTNSWIPYIITFVVCLIGAIRVYIGGAKCPSEARIDGKVVVITGGSGGLGLATAKELAKRGGHIILGIRNAEKGMAAMDSLKEYCPEGRAIVKMVDLSDFTSIREFANQLKLEYDKIDILINNAGIIFHPYGRTVDGNELTMSTNYFGPFLLTHLLLPLLHKSDGARVINISAVAHMRGKMRLDDLNLSRGFREVEAFAQSKLALTLFTKQMASLLKHTKITFNSVNPGLVRGTEHLRKSSLTTSFLTRVSIAPWMWLFMKNPKQGCQSIVHAAVDPTLNTVSGCYMGNCEFQKASDLTNDTGLLDTLYKKTCEIVGLEGEDIIRGITHEF